MNTFARRLAAAAGATLLGLGVAAPAHAEGWAHNDPRGDVTSSTACDDTASSCTDVIDATATQPDIIRVVTRHTTDRVTVIARYAELINRGARVHQFRVVTDEGVRRRYWLALDGGTIVVNELDRDSDGRKVACSGLRHSIDYVANTVALSIPRSCLSFPHSVRVGFGSAVIRDRDDVSRGFKADDALRSGLSPSTSDLAIGPRLVRG